MSINHTNLTVKTPNPEKQNLTQQNLIGLSDSTYHGAVCFPYHEGPKIFKGSGQKFNPQKHLTEVRGIEVYDSTVVVKRHSKSAIGGGKRSRILNLSADSLGRLAFIAFNTPVNFRSMQTLTYPREYSNDGQAVKVDLANLLRWYRRNFPGELHLWWLEFQKRGAPHFHVLSTVDLASYGKLSTIKRQKKGKVETWQTHWETWKAQEQTWRNFGGGHTAWEVINDAEGGKKYAAKYATKAYQKAVPQSYRNVGRFWGHSREGVKPRPSEFYECSEVQLRQALQRGGWEHLPDDGEVLYRELYQAAKAIDLNQLSPVNGLPSTKYPKLEAVTSEYRCECCGVTSEKWAGQCSNCGEWDTLVLLT